MSGKGIEATSRSLFPGPGCVSAHLSAQVSAHSSTGPGQVEQLGAVDLAGELLDVALEAGADNFFQPPRLAGAMALQVL